MDTKVDPKALRAAASHGDEMQAGVGTAVGNLNSQHQGVPGEADGAEFAVELMKTLRSWHDRLGDVRKETVDITQSLRTSADNYEKNDERTSASFKRPGKAEGPPVARIAASHDNPFG